MKTSAPILSLIVLLSTVVGIRAATFNVDFNKNTTGNYIGAGVVPGAGTIWNSLLTPSANTHTQSLVDSTGNTSPASITIVRNNGQAIKTWDAATGGNPNPSPLMRDYLYQGPYTVSISNLDPGTYTLYAFAHGDKSGQVSNITLDAANGGPSGITTDSGDFRDIFQSSAAGNSYLALTGTVSATGTFSFTASAYLNGFQLDQHPALPQVADGFGHAATGGAGGPVYTVSNSADLIARATSTERCIITVSGTIDVIGGAGADGKSVRVRSNKTIQGLDANSAIIGCLDLGSGGVDNVIIRHLNITHPGTTIGADGKYTDGGDGIAIWGATNVFVTQCSFVDCADGACDITQGSDLVTVSWCRFSYTAASLAHRFPMILGNTSISDYRVTLHHNWFAEGCDQRMPSGSYSRAHIYNNYFSCVGNAYCTNVRTGGEFLVENNHYVGVNHPCYKESGGKLLLSGNIFSNCTGHPPGYDLTAGSVTGNDTVFTVPYAYQLDSAVDVPALVTARAGNTSATPIPAFISLGGLSHTYDGLPKPVTYTTDPAGLMVNLTYDGSPNAPTAAGSYPVVATIADGNYQGSASATLVIEAPSGWQSWIQSHFTAEQILAGKATPAGNPDGDGFPNLAEYALGMDPWIVAPPLQMTLDNDGLALIFDRPSGLSDVTCLAESSEDLTVWNPVPLEVITSGDIETVRARDPLTAGDPSRRFIRLRFIGSLDPP